LKGAGDCSLPKNFLTRSLCTFPGVSPQEPSCAKECISLLSQPGFTAHSTVCNLLDFTSTQLSCCKFPQEKQPKGLGSADILAHLRGQSCNGIRPHLGFPAHQTVLAPDVLWIYWAIQPTMANSASTKQLCYPAHNGQ